MPPSLWRHSGFTVYEAGNADEAIALLEQHADIRAVFTDIHMPGSMDGLKFAHYVRGRWPPVKLILTSGHARPRRKTCQPEAGSSASPTSSKRLRPICGLWSGRGYARATARKAASPQLLASIQSFEFHSQPHLLELFGPTAKFRLRHTAFVIAIEARARNPCDCLRKNGNRATRVPARWTNSA